MDRIGRQQLWKTMAHGPTEKSAELANTFDMPWSPGISKKTDVGKDKAVINKTASVDDCLRTAFGIVEEEPEVTKIASPTVDVSHLEPPTAAVFRHVEKYACPSLQRYPLDAYTDVVKAAAYFEEYHPQMSLPIKREFALNLVPRAAELHIGLSKTAEQYGATTSAGPEHRQIALDLRRSALLDEEQHATLDKLAAVQPLLNPETFADVLGQFDVMNGLDHLYGRAVPDPILSTFDKVAETTTLAVGNESLPLEKFKTFAQMGQETVAKRFGEDFAQEFAKDPKGIFDSLPRDQKLIMLRMASAVDASNQSASVS